MKALRFSEIGLRVFPDFSGPAENREALGLSFYGYYSL